MEVSTIPAAQFHITLRIASSSPASQCRSPIGSSGVLNRKTSLTVTRPSNDPCSSTSITRGLCQQQVRTRALLYAQDWDKRGTYPILLNNCITISSGSCGETIRGVLRTRSENIEKVEQSTVPG